MKYYIAGPMTGYKNFNFDAFEAQTKLMRTKGMDVVSPHECVVDQSTPWVECMKTDLRAMLECGHVVALEGYENSLGAMIEITLAKLLSYEVTLVAGGAPPSAVQAICQLLQVVVNKALKVGA